MLIMETMGNDFQQSIIVLAGSSQALIWEYFYCQLQGGKVLQYGQVSAAELVQAVHEMLSAAGVNMDVEKQSLLQRTLTLHEQLKESQAALLLEQVCETISKFSVII